MKSAPIACILIINSFFLFAQHSPDTTRMLDEIVVEGYLYKRPIADVPASIAILTKAELERFNNTSLLPVLNSVPGVRMEERSPGSYRLSIRGSMIRSPFGIRNIKVYRNGLPLTDGGGNTYLNLLDFSSVDRIEVIKGPGGSLYGAGTGGVVLLNSRFPTSNGAEISALMGSYGLTSYQVKSNLAGRNISGSVNYAMLESNGYREQAALKRHSINSDLNFTLNSKTSLAATGFYTDIFYETPGGLNESQYRENPAQARPAAGPFKSAAEQNALVNNETGYFGLILDREWSESWTSRIGVFTSSTEFENYAVANYESRNEFNTGTRMETSYTFKRKSWKGKFSFGLEFQYMDSPIRVFENNSGNKGPLTIHDELWSNQFLLFSQMEIDFESGYFFTAGLSENWLSYKFVRNFPDKDRERKRFSPIPAPRFALLKKLGNNYAAHTSISIGFSPPTLAEVRPSTNSFNENLKAEKGINYEIGIRGQAGDFFFDLTGYYLRMNETIVLKRVESGAEYFINAGTTNQKGIELTMTWQPWSIIKLWGSGSYNHYRFKQYLRYDEVLQKEVDYSNNKLTGVAPFVSTLGIDLSTSFGMYINLTHAYTGRIPLNDANDEYAEDYFLFGGRVGYKQKFSEKFTLDTFVAIDNAFDEKYSLGNDLNARGRRFYNAAPGRNFTVGIKFQVF